MFDITDEDISKIESEIGNNIYFDDYRKKILKDNSSFDVQACPGSGKTTLLAAKLLILSKKWNSKSKGVCVLSHTNVAKNEIIKRLENHPTGWTFLKFPHFIGTIQELVNRFLAIPYIRDNHWPISFIDSGIYNKKGWSLLANKTKKHLGNRHINSVFDLQFRFNADKLQFNIPGFSKKSTSDSFNDLVKVKQILTRDGYFQYREMYELGKANLHTNPIIINLLQKRFSFLFIDEMQDTQKFQDELLQSIFPKTGPTVVQRFGDDDQAIFSEIGNEEPNESFVGRDCKYRVSDTNRFSPCICGLIRGLSSSKIPLESTQSCINNGKHEECARFGKNIIFTVNDGDSAKKVVHQFVSHVKAVFGDTNEKCIKVIGAIGKDGENLNINSYCIFNRDKRRDQFKPESHYEAIAIVKDMHKGNTNDNYNIIINSIITFLNDNDILIALDKRRITRTDLMDILNQKKLKTEFNQILGMWLFAADLPSEEEWEQSIEKLSNILAACTSISKSLNTFDYFSFPSDEILQKFQSGINANTVNAGTDLNLDINTIHGIKGETHDATLVLETCLRNSFDIGGLINLTFDTFAKIKKGNKTQPKQMKQLYVAMSRPREILCIAVNDKRITAFKDKLQELGWIIKNVNDEG